MVQLSLAPARNEKLFSRNYLEDRLPKSQEWKKSEEEAREAWKELKDVYEKEKGDLSNRKNDEEGLRHKFISPILENVLNYSIEKEKTAFGSSSPDYALYIDEEKRSNALDSDDTYSNAVGLLEAKAWEKKLEMKKKDGGQLYDRLNPTVQVMEYLYNSEPRWAVLTNGKRWRLYNQEASSKMDTYYEVNLITILENDDFKQFKYFYLLFRKEAIEGGKGEAFVDKVREQSNKYARDVGEDLEENLYQALLWLTKGISNVNNNDIDPEEELDKLQNESLIFLYRLVFLFYVDSREIMPDPAEQGEDLYSFPSLVDEVLEDIENDDVSEVQTKYFNKLGEVFKMVKKGSEAQGIDREKLFVPAYNGKLFSSKEHEFLKENTIKDKYLAKVIELLARDDDNRRIDYSDLSVRHLGGIYEGLLEYELNYASEPKVLEEGKYKKLSDLNKDREDFDENDVVDEELYLATDDEERKATGSYYTPDYIVEYIVENTVGPKVEERIEKAKEEADNKHERDQLVQEKVLDLNILDPAMGSGHFLVEVIDHIASEILEYTEKDIQGVKRDVARRCIYGVDINNMATELAKVSIWLNTISSEKPLSFLDHRIKTGNSLIGADIHEIDRHPEEDEDSERQVTIGEEFGEENAGVVRANVQKMLEKFKEIQQKEEDSPEDIKEQEKLYEEFLDFSFRKRFDVLADVYTSHYFDNNYKVDDYNRLLQAFKLSEQKEEGDEEWNQVIKEDWVQKATDSLNNSHKEDNTSSKKGFFHWKLEFPEVFFDIEEGIEKQDSGFDAIVGNPPYVSVKDIPDETRNFLKEQTSYFIKRGDLYVSFLELADNLVSSSGKYNYIIPYPFLSQNYAEDLRNQYLNNLSISEITDFSNYEVFEDASVRNITISINKSKESEQVELRTPDLEPNKIEKIESREVSLERFKEFYRNMIRIDALDQTPLLRSIEKNTFNLGDICLIKFGARGKHSEKRKRDTFKKMLKGEGVRRYKHEWTGKYLIYEEESLYRPSHSAIFENEKIVISYVTGEEGIRSSIDRDEYYTDNSISCCVLKHDLESVKEEIAGRKVDMSEEKIQKSSEYELEEVIGLLNSKLLNFYFRTKLGYDLNVYPNYLQMLPIPESTVDEDLVNIDSNVQQIRGLKKNQDKLNLDIKDYIGNYSDGKTLEEVYIPASDVSNTVLDDTKEDRENLKIGDIKFEEAGETLVLYSTAKYKPEEDEDFDEEEKDQWGYIETDFFPAMRFNVDEKMRYLIEEFVPISVENEEAGFKKKATKSTSIRGRLEDIQLPKVNDVSKGLDKFIKNKEKAQQLEREIQNTENEIDAIVFDLYDLTEEEVETVLDSLDTPEGEKDSILKKFDEVEKETN